VVLFWQPSQIRVWALSGTARHLAHACSVGALGLFVWGFLSLKRFDPLGTAELLGALRQTPPEPCDFVARGAYRRVRHPLYLAVIVLIWACPDAAADRLLFDLSWTAWIVVGTRLEEADLVAELGDTYRAYQERVPMLVDGWVAGQVAIMALVVFGPSAWPGLPAWPMAPVFTIGGGVGVVLGIALAIAGIAALGRNLSAAPRPKEGAVLVDRGPYRFVRHPMYAGATLAAFGWALAIHGSLTLLYAALLLAFFVEKSRREERWLCAEVAGYAAYRARKGRLLPRLR